MKLSRQIEGNLCGVVVALAVLALAAILFAGAYIALTGRATAGRPAGRVPENISASPPR